MHIFPEKYQFRKFARQLQQERLFHPAVFLCGDMEIECRVLELPVALFN